jgi:hypothetical protein
MRDGTQAETCQHVDRLVVFLAQVFHQGAGCVAVAVDRTKDDVGPFQGVLELLCTAVHMAVMVFENPTGIFDKPPVKGFHAADAAHDQDTFPAKASPLLTRILCISKELLFFKDIPAFFNIFCCSGDARHSPTTGHLKQVSISQNLKGESSQEPADGMDMYIPLLHMVSLLLSFL